MTTPTPDTPPSPKEIEGIKPDTGPAGGWGALGAVAHALRRQMAVGRDTRMLLKVNQPEGVDCPGCAWPDPKHTSSFEFCENGAKAVSWEATSKRTTPEFFSQYTVSDLWRWSDHQLEDQGRLTHPMIYDAAQDKYLPIEWDAAMQHIGEALRALPHPDMAEFYTSGRTSNEAAFLYQLFVREYGTNNFPDCSNMCHEATSVGLPPAIGVGKGTVTLEDFDHCDAIFCIGHNPGTNHPRMLTTLREASKRNVPIVVLNPLAERGLERFTSPQHAMEMATLSSTRIASTYYKLRVGGDQAVLQGMMKLLVERDAASMQAGGQPVLDHDFINDHTANFEAFSQDLRVLTWEDIQRHSGLTRKEIESVTDIYAQAKRVIICYGMGITQHVHGTQNVQQISNLLLLRGNIGRQGAGICPLRGHSNVQGDRTVGITEIPNQALLDGIEKTFGFKPPSGKGHSAVESIAAIRDGASRALICLGGNLAVAISDPQATFAAMRKLDLAVHIATKLNRSHLITAKTSILLPCLGRTELDVQGGNVQTVTVEDSMSMVHASRGSLPPASDQLLSEPAIIARMAMATLPHTRVDWHAMVADYSLIRDAIEKVFPDFAPYNERIKVPGGFRLTIASAERKWLTPNGRANFMRTDALATCSTDTTELTLTTIRSHDQYNTTIYSESDRYRGVTSRRDVVFVNAQDLADLGLAHGDRVDIVATRQDGTHRAMNGVTAVAFEIAQGSVAVYYPEGNGMIALADHDPQSLTPAYKSVPVRMTRAA